LEEAQRMTKDEICREYVRLGTLLPREAVEERKAIAVLQQEAEAVLATDTLALVTLTKKLEEYTRQTPKAPPAVRDMHA
jgi:hypothetical protein